MIYPGGKNADGVFQRIINQIPPHRVYIEPFAGSGAILRHKRPAERSIAVELDPGALALLREGARAIPKCRIVPGDGIGFLDTYRFDGSEFVYADPTYLPYTRRGRRTYRRELMVGDHRRLLAILLRLRCPVMLSGYWSELYAGILREWRTDHFRVMTRGGSAEEWLWMNYPPPVELHDYRYVGRNFREREKFKRQRQRWTARLRKMDPLRRQALLAAIGDLD